MPSLQTSSKSALASNDSPQTSEATPAGAPASKTGPHALVPALEDACPGPLEKTMSHHLDELRLHAIRATVEGAPIMAERRLMSLPRDTQERILKDFLEHPPGGIRHWPTYPYASIPTFAAPHNVESESRYTEMCKSLLATGLLPAREVEEALTTLALNSKDRIHDDQTLALCGLVSLGVLVAGTFNSKWVTGAAILYGAHLCNKFITRLDPREELFMGLILENRDALDTIRREDLPDLKSTLVETFERRGLRAHFQRHLQREGFLAARTLRLLGVDPVTIAELFDSSTRRDAPKNYLAEKARDELKLQGHRVQYSLTHTLELESAAPTSNSLSDFLEVLNRAYFTWAFHEKHLVRESFASSILSAT